MSKLLDLVIAVQLSTCIAFFCAIGAHLVSNHANENWQFSVYVLNTIGVLFMLIPYLIFDREESNEK